MKCLDIEVAVATYFQPRQHFVIIPNAAWGLGFRHELDLLIVRKSGYAIEVEIKVSRSDLKRDVLKRHGHQSRYIKELYFAVPEKLVEAAKEFAPERAGIIGVGDAVDGHPCHTHRPSTPNRDALPFNDRMMKDAARLGALRIWDLKRSVRDMRSRLVALQEAQKPHSM
jgi:hypothetical protein